MGLGKYNRNGDGESRSQLKYFRGISRTFCAMGLLGLALVLSSCKQQNTLAPLDRYLKQESPPPKKVSVDFCTDPAVVQKYVVKTVVILDHSGSNQQNYLMNPDGSGAPDMSSGSIDIEYNYATDPTGTLRYGDINTSGTLLNYLYTTPQNDPANPTRYFALVDFSNSAKTYPPSSSGFTSDVEDFYNHVQADAEAAGTGPSDNGSTSYLSALGATYNIINADIQNAQSCARLSPTTAPTTSCPHPGMQVASSYVIIFMSDGAPITSIYVNGSSISLNSEPTDQILGQVQSIMGLTANTKFVAGVNLFTVYYYNQLNNLDKTGQSLLAQMAKLGNGIAYNAVSGSKLDYSRFIPPSKVIKYTLSDVFVTNSSVIQWKDGTLQKDTDGDGLPDDLEIAWGSNLNDPDTNGNGVSDLVEYIHNDEQPCNSKSATGKCLDNHDYAANECSSISSAKSGGRTTFVSSNGDPNGMNDCEKLLLNDVGGIGNPDSNGDIIPDWLEFRNNVPFQLGASSASNSSSDGYSLYQKIKLSLPTQFPLNQLLGVKPANYDMNQVSTSAVQDCYHLNVTDLPMIGDNNNIRVDVVEKSGLLQDRYLYRTAQKIFPAGADTLQFNDWNDAGEKAANTWKEWGQP